MPKAQLIAGHLGEHGEAVHGLIVPILPQYGRDEFVAAGEVVEGPAELIGVRPHWRAPKDGDDLQFLEVTRNDDGTVKGVHDLGYGLLAQVDVWADPDAPRTDENGEG